AGRRWAAQRKIALRQRRATLWRLRGVAFGRPPRGVVERGEPLWQRWRRPGAGRRRGRRTLRRPGERADGVTAAGRAEHVHQVPELAAGLALPVDGVRHLRYRRRTDRRRGRGRRYRAGLDGI